MVLWTKAWNKKKGEKIERNSSLSMYKTTFCSVKFSGTYSLEVVKQKKVAVLLQKALTFVPRVTIEPLNLIAKVINHLRIGFLVLVL